jgi:hypothetical protein
MAYAALDKSTSIGREHLEAALALRRYLFGKVLGNLDALPSPLFTTRVSISVYSLSDSRNAHVLSLALFAALTTLTLMAL